MADITYDEPKVQATQQGGHMFPKTPGMIIGKMLMGLVIIIVGGFLWKWVTTPMLVTVTGTGSVVVPATSASISITVSSAQNTVAAALTDAQTKVSAVKEVLIKNNVQAEEISVSQVQV